MLALFENIVRSQLQIQKTDRVLVAVSGGMDSMCLLELFRLIDQPIAIAHCNYHLRGEDSNLDAELVLKTAERHKIKSHIQDFYMDKSNHGVQEQARNLRYEWFNELLNEHSYNFLAAAHHLDDQIETFMINLIRGTGIEGLSGIKIKRGHLIRPLIKFTRKEIESFAQLNNVNFRLDKSNESDDYLRNRIRHKITPFLLKENNNFHATFLRTTDKINQTKDILNKYIEQIKNNQKNKSSIDFSSLPVGSFNLTLYHLLREYGITWSQVENIKENKNKSGLIFHTNSHSLLLNRNNLIIQLKGKSKPIKEIIIEHPKTTKINNLGTLVISNVTEAIQNKDPKEEFIDGDKINWPLKIRPWQPGDRFSPLGMNNQQKKVKKYLIDQKINLFDKSDILVLEDQDSIIWIIGHRLDHRVRTTSQTNNILKLKLNLL